MPLQKKILLVDDDKDVLEVIGKRLQISGYDVLTASSGHQAMEILAGDTPHLILLDISLPDIDGMEVCNRIKKQEDTADIPVIFFTAKASVEDKIKGLQKGVYDYITKPIDHRELLARIDSALERHRYFQENLVVDALTGLYNYKFFNKDFSHIFNVAKRYKTIFSLIIVDINQFKKINDTYGHLCGNFVLKRVSEGLKNNIRRADIVFRTGGDEFAILLPETDGKKAVKVVEKLKKNIGCKYLIYNGNKFVVTLSLGFASYSEGIQTEDELFDIADKNMYEEKRAGNSSD